MTGKVQRTATKGWSKCEQFLPIMAVDYNVKINCGVVNRKWQSTMVRRR